MEYFCTHCGGTGWLGKYEQCYWCDGTGKGIVKMARTEKFDSSKGPFFENGFWWWYDPKRKGWYVGCSPGIGKPSWAE
jgi:hypothetical protein